MDKNWKQLFENCEVMLKTGETWRKTWKKSLKIIGNWIKNWLKWIKSAENWSKIKKIIEKWVKVEMKHETNRWKSKKIHRKSWKNIEKLMKIV